jgi:3-oxoacyl-[acyl-carrier protein] reductase
MRRVIEGRFGPIDVLVTNAGGSFTRPGPFELIPEDRWHASVEGNLTATFLTIKSFLPGMKSRRSGNIITISSSAGRRAHPMSPLPYAVAKAGIQLLTQNLAAEVGPLGIRANCIAPETILTDRNKELIPMEQQDSMAQWHPLRRLGMPDDMAEAALFLASEGASWMTGIILDVAGGMVMA